MASEGVEIVNVICFMHFFLTLMITPILKTQSENAIKAIYENSLTYCRRIVIGLKI